MEKLLKSFIVLVLLCFVRASSGCKPLSWYNMTMEQLLLKSDVVVYGKDVDHGKYRLPMYLDARFDVYCVFKSSKYLIPGQVIIENIYGGDDCSGVQGQTEEGQEYILGLTRQLSGFMSYAAVNPTQQSAFPVTVDNLRRVAASCGLDDWTPPKTGDQNLCPVPMKPRFCTKIRYPEDLNASGTLTSSLLVILVTLFVRIL